VSTPKIHEGLLTAADRRFAFVVGRFNHFIVDRLVEGAIDTIVRHGGRADNIEIFRAPGAFELPVLAKRVAQADRFDAIIALGAVIRGSTPHFDYVAGECVKGIATVGLEFNVPISFGVLTCDTIEQAIERAGTKAGNKGAEAALAAIEMADLFARLSGAREGGR
jgi:6,7-dimethyl-8-ribityllumazine synthase